MAAALELGDRFENLMTRKQVKRGFTLVELLVVMGIIAVLVGVLMPTLIAARRRALSVKCLSTERQIAQAAMIQSIWHHGYVQIGGAQWIRPATGTGWLPATPDGLGDPYADRYSYYDDGGTRRPIPFFACCARVMNVRLDFSSRANLQASLSSGDALRAFVCPAQETLQSGSTISDRSGWKSPLEAAGYLLNEEVLGFRSWTASTPHGRLERVNRPGRVVFFTDGKPRVRYEPLFSIWAGKAGETLSDFALADYFNGFQSLDYVRHKGSINVAFCDGHAENFDMGTPNRVKLGNLALVALTTGG